MFHQPEAPWSQRQPKNPVFCLQNTLHPRVTSRELVHKTFSELQGLGCCCCCCSTRVPSGVDMSSVSLLARGHNTPQIRLDGSDV